MAKNLSWVTIGVILLTTVIAIVGGAVVIWGHPGALSFQEYIDTMWKFAVAVGIVGVGQGIKSGLENQAGGGSGLSDPALLAELVGAGKGDGDALAAQLGTQRTAPTALQGGHV
jgi:hypothetical protein